jgi:hypothetical protein
MRKKDLFLGGGKKAYERRLIPLPGRKGGLDKQARESKVISSWHAYHAEGSRVPPGTRMECMQWKPLRWASRGHHYT